MSIRKIASIFAIFLLVLASCADEEYKSTPGEDINDKIEDITSGNDIEQTHTTKKTQATGIQNTLTQTNQDEEILGMGFVTMLLVFIIFFGLILTLFFWYFVPLGLWYEARLSGLKPGWWQMSKMRFQGIPQKMIIETLILAKNAGLEIATADIMQKYLAGVDVKIVTRTAIRAINAGFEVSYNELASQFLAKVNVETIMHALITAKNAEIEVSLKELAAYYLANVDVIKVVEALITAHNAGYDVFTLKDLKEHYLANGDVIKTVDAFIAAKEAHFKDLEFKDIAAIDLAGLDVTKTVHSAVYPIVVETPTVTGVALDGVQLHMKLKLTLRTNLKNVIGGATEQTVLARVDESLATEIGHAATHFDVLKNPFKLADLVEGKHLGDGTAFEILSIDVSEVTVGEDLHAVLQSERARADIETAKAKLVNAEEKVKKSMASAFMDGNLSIEQYQKFMNTEADTEMRKKLAKNQEAKKELEHGHEHEHEPSLSEDDIYLEEDDE